MWYECARSPFTSEIGWRQNYHFMAILNSCARIMNSVVTSSLPFLSLVFRSLCSFFYTGSVLNIHIFVGFIVQAFLFNCISFLFIRACWTIYHFIIISHVYFSLFLNFTSENTMSPITCFFYISIRLH